MLEPAEYPPFDEAAWRLLNAAIDRIELGTAPPASDPQYPAFLLRQERFGEALAVREQIVERRPDQIAAAFQGASFRTMLRDPFEDHHEAATHLVEQVRQQIARLPREEAVGAAFRLISLENDLAEGNGQTYRTRRRQFVDQYRGTQAALLAEVDVLLDGPTTRASLESLRTFAREHDGTLAGAKAIFLRAQRLEGLMTSGREPPESLPANLSAVIEAVAELERGAYPPNEWSTEPPVSPHQSSFRSVPIYARPMSGMCWNSSSAMSKRISRWTAGLRCTTVSAI